jgi:nucleotide-binding universal stress UspA family protein
MKVLNIKKILVPVDFSLTSLKALEQAVFMAKKNNAEITLLHVVDYIMPHSDIYYFTIPRSAEYEATVMKECDGQLLKLAEKIQKKDAVTIHAETVSGKPREQIIAAAERIQADMIVMGTHGVSGFREFMIGSTAIRIISEAPCPVLSIQQSVAPGFKKILVPFRNRPHSREKVDYAIEMAEMYGATVHVLGVDAELSEETNNKLILQAEQIKTIAENHHIPCETKVIEGSFLAEEILKYAKDIQADLVIVMSDLDKMSVSDFIMGPYAQQIVNHSHIPILSIHPTFNSKTVNLGGYGW